MLESIINPKRVEKGPWKMFFVGLIYASLSLLLVHWWFSADAGLSQASGMLVVAFCIMFTLPFMYYLIKREENEDEQTEGVFRVWNVHKDAIYAFMWLFIGFIVAFSFWHIVLNDTNLLNFQVDAYCRINSPGNVENCIENSIKDTSTLTGQVSKEVRTLSILENNVYVMIFTLLFSLFFGAGAIFVLIWNASVIAAAIGIFADYHISNIPIGFARYMIHGFPEIAAYFVAALAGGMFGVGFIRHGYSFKNKKFLKVLENSIMLLFLAIVILVVAAIMEVYLTPIFFA